MATRRYATPAEIKRAHELSATGMSSSEIGREMGISDRTVRGWLNRPVPPPRTRPSSNKVAILLTDGELAELDRVAVEQGDAPRSRILMNAWHLYRDAMARLRDGSSEPLNIQGYR